MHNNRKKYDQLLLHEKKTEKREKMTVLPLFFVSIDLVCHLCGRFGVGMGELGFGWDEVGCRGRSSVGWIVERGGNMVVGRILAE